MTCALSSSIDAQKERTRLSYRSFHRSAEPSEPCCVVPMLSRALTPIAMSIWIFLLLTVSMYL